MKENPLPVNVDIKNAVQSIKAAILKSQARSAQMINHEQLSLYYGIGRFVSEHSRNGFWGTGAIDSISKQLRAELPGLKGFSAENIKLMRRFFEAWKDLERNSADTTTEIAENSGLQPPTNSVDTTTELQLIESEAKPIRQLQLTHDETFPVTAWVDLLFFNRELQSLVVVELKKGQFKPSYLGQLAAYLRVLDDEEKLPGENPSVGIILCKKADKAYVEYVLQDYLKPMGVATYQQMQNRLRELLPPEEDMKRLIEE